jgi:hypothetical protein
LLIQQVSPHNRAQSSYSSLYSEKCSNIRPA